MAERHPWRRLIRAVTVLAGLTLVSGCASWPQGGTVEAGAAGRAPSSTAPSQSPAQPSEPAGAGSGTAQPPAPTYHPAGQALIVQAKQQAAAGETAGAGATLERALRVDPDNPWIWIELARVRYDEGDASAGQAMARKALSLSGRDREAAEVARRLSSGAGP